MLEPCRFTHLKSALVKFVAFNVAELTKALLNKTFEKSAPWRFAWVKVAPDMVLPLKSAPDRSASVKSAQASLA